nr:IclR family transcriptional regulator [Propionicimonas sp.]
MVEAIQTNEPAEVAEMGAAAPAPRRSVQSITRALEILEALAAAGRAVGITDIAERVDLPLPTIHRILHTLIKSGYVFQTPRRQYALGARLITLSRYAGGALGVTLRPYLTKLVETTGESASIAMLDQDFARYISHVPAEYSMRMFTEVGNQVSLHATGVGKAILASMPLDEARTILNRSGLRRFTLNTITDVDEMMAELDTIRRQGYALDREEHELGVKCVAVPLPGPLRLTISVSGPPQRLTDDEITGTALPALRAAVDDITPAIKMAMLNR